MIAFRGKEEEREKEENKEKSPPVHHQTFLLGKFSEMKACVFVFILSFCRYHMPVLSAIQSCIVSAQTYCKLALDQYPLRNPDVNYCNRLKVLHVCYPPGSNCFRSIHLLREHECQRKTTESGVHSTYICTPYKPLLLFLMSSVVSRNKII
ncbi:uncharacterized protein LOC106875519 isoform X1 [Octopus bimaculoides]|uniref:uncharacterized protein LOC106875519 isoform X1 n=1 Tax=Octopus bimaculoides TaxID=37653 RepID=UPI0022E05231|nr:uncharacterized protein LOC106875519 isoform X1 [Octopus bimaculoides]